MARRPRHDSHDSWHHVMNRGIARRTMFENDQDRRFFLALLAREVRAGRIEVHAYCLMLTHFHLLLRSPKGQLSEAMQRIQTSYSRWFNRSRRRDGTLVRGRFLSEPIHEIGYRCNVVTYLHDNPLKAGITALPAHYPWSSAWHWGRRDTAKMPSWLSTDWIQSELDARRATSLEAVFPSRLDDEFRTWIERRMSRRLPEDLDDATMSHVVSKRTVRWAIRKAQLADGTRPFRAISPARVVEIVLRKWMRKTGPLLGFFSRPRRDAWTNLRAGVLRALSGCTQYEIGLRIRRHASTICRDLKEHRVLMRSVKDYEALHASVTDAVIGAVRRADRVATV